MSKTSIVNKALSHLGANKITSLSDGSLESQCANILYEGSLRSVLSECCWKFATKRVMLNKIDKCPAWAENGMFNYFQLPSDLVKLFDIKDKTVLWDREGETILANTDSFGIKYVYLCNDTTQYPQYFIDAFACKLASDMCYDITNSNEKTNSQGFGSCMYAFYALYDGFCRAVQLRRGEGCRLARESRKYAVRL